MQSLTIGQVAKRAGVGIETIRYYERRGLLEAPRRRDSGYRVFSQNEIRRLIFIREAKALGFTLAEIEDLLALRTDTRSGCREVQALGRAKILEVEKKIAVLQKMRRVLKKLVTQCPGEGPKNDCPILDALDGDTQKEA